MIKSLENILDYESECSTIDFKHEQYPLGNHPKKHEILKDISAMANFPSDDDKFIIIGVDESSGRPSGYNEINNLIDQASYQQYLNSNIEPNINFDYKAFKYKGYNLAYFRIFNNKDRPYLIKRDVANGTQIELREGDGFIRVGTSTRRLTRPDFDKIYNSKFHKIDRKKDLIITPYFGTPEDEMISKLKYFDISIENNSNSSIEIELEMKVYKGDQYDLFDEIELIRELKKARSKSDGLYGYTFPVLDTPTFDFHVHYKDSSDYILVSTTKAIKISQRSIEKDIFNKRIILVEEEDNIIKAEITVRSDDFTEGLLSETLEIKK